MENTCGDKMHLELAIGINYCMPSIVPPGETHYYLRLLRKEIHDLPFPLISPLRPNYRDYRHSILLFPSNPLASILSQSLSDLPIMPVNHRSIPNIDPFDKGVLQGKFILTMILKGDNFTS
jgi:hypothetical protein